VLEDLVGVDDVMAAVELEEVGHAELDAGVVGLGGGDGLGRAVHPDDGGDPASAVRHRCERSTGSEWPCV
jgi:hypothetical protein